jgi:hypothetical protein
MNPNRTDYADGDGSLDVLVPAVVGEQTHEQLGADTRRALHFGLTQIGDHFALPAAARAQPLALLLGAGLERNGGEAAPQVLQPLVQNLPRHQI